jgi:hypothetical protein
MKAKKSRVKKVVSFLVAVDKDVETYSRKNSLMKLAGILCLVTMFFGGCAGRAITYSLEDPEIQKPPRPVPMRLMVATFKDSRSEEEKTGGGKGKGLLATHDRFFQNVPEGITKAVVGHLQKSELFQEIRPATFSSAEVTRERLESSRSDAVMGGMVGAGAATGLLGALVVMGIESTISKDVEGHAALVGLELIRTKDGSSLWKGQAEAYFKRNEKGLPEAPNLALEALKEAVTKLVDQLRDFAAGLEPAVQQPAELTHSTM